MGAALVSLGYIPEEQLVRVLARELGVPAVRLEGKRIDPAMCELVDKSFAEQSGCVPLFNTREGGGQVLYLGMEDPHDLATLDELRFRLGIRVRPVLVGPLQLREAVSALYGTSQDPAATLPEAHDHPDSDPDSEPDTAPLFFPSAHRSEDEPAHEPVDGEDFKPEDPERPNEVPTRQILRAVTRLLLAKGVFERDELIETVRAVGNGEE